MTIKCSANFWLKKIQMTLDYEVDIAFGFAEAKELMNNDYFLAFVDLCLPDAPNGEVVDYIIEKKNSCYCSYG